jgi:TonB family protein
MPTEPDNTSSRARKPLSLALLLLLFAAATYPSRAQDVPADEAWQHYKQALSQSSLQWLESLPYEIHLDYELYDLSGKAASTGTATEVWGDVPSPKLTIQSATLTYSEAQGDMPSQPIRERYLVLQVLKSIERPFPKALTESQVQEVPVAMEGTTDTCKRFDSKLEPPSSTIYCFDADGRLREIYGEHFVLHRSDFRRSLGRDIPMETTLEYIGRIALIARVTELDNLHPQAVSDSLKGKTPQTAVPGTVVAGYSTSRKQPKYPKLARAAHIAGSVVLSAIITKEGSIRDLTVIASPDDMFSKAAVDAVSTWTYKPYVLDGKPTEVDTTITVNFALNR